MRVKIDTREKFHVITVLEKELPANMAEPFEKLVRPFLDATIKNVIISMPEVEKTDRPFAMALLQLQNDFYEKSCSFVVCSLTKELENWLDEEEILELLNVTPTESEAWDIVQLEEIEREFLD